MHVATCRTSNYANKEWKIALNWMKSSHFQQPWLQWSTRCPTVMTAPTPELGHLSKRDVTCRIIWRHQVNREPNSKWILEDGTFKNWSSWWFRNWFQFFFGVKSDWAQVDSCRVGFNVPEFLDLARWPRKSRLQTVRLGTFLNCAGLHVYRERSCIPCILYLYCINPQCMTLWMHVCGTYVYVCF